MFAIRYDLRCPAWSPAAPADIYAAALEQAAFVDRHGLGAIVVSEHHGIDDGYLPSPLVLAAAIAGRTASVHISLSALIAPLHDPLRLAEDVAVLDLASGGRISLVIGLGYRREEYEQLGRAWKGRGMLLDEVIEVLLQAWTGDPFEFRGRRVRVTPRPLQQPHPMVFVGGSSVAAARRAARFGLGFLPTVGDQALADAYHAECERLGVVPGIVGLPRGPAFVHVADDPDRAWAEVGEHLLHDARSYASWQPPGQRTHVTAGDTSSVDALRGAGTYRIVTPDECVALVREHGSVILHPLIGGMPPEHSWAGLQLIADRVVPALSA